MSPNSSNTQKYKFRMMWLFSNAFFSGCSLHETLYCILAAVVVQSIKSLLKAPRTACNLNFYFWWLTAFKLLSLTISPFQGNLCRLLTNNCATLYLCLWILIWTVTSVFFIAQNILFSGTFPESKSMLFLTGKHLTSERRLMKVHKS